MSILLAVIGATIGATIGSLFMHWRKDVARERQQLESKTPYDYALTNAINERDRLQDELRTIQALERTEADTERIRNEIDTILSEVGEEAPEDVYDGQEAYMRSCEATDEQFLRTMEWQKKDGEIRHPAARAAMERERKHTPYKYYGVERMKSESAIVATINAADYGESIPIQTHSDGTVTPILPKSSELDTSPMSAITGMSMEEWAESVSKAFAEAYGTYVREDDTEYEQLSEDDVERSLTKAVRDSFENREIIRVAWRDSYGSLRFRRGVVDEIATGDGEVKEFGMRGLEIFARDVVRIKKGDDTGGETLYRKGNR